VRNSSICCAGARPRPALRLLAVTGFVVAALLACPAAEAKKKNYSPDFLIQPFLGPEYAQWLIGPIARMATEQEIEAYLALQDDAAAASFIEEFWKKRDPQPQFPDNRARELFEERAAEVDSLYGETLYRGRYTDRGTIYVLYGKPEKVDREVAPFYGGSALEVWSYSKDAEPGLDGEKPERLYRFIRDGDRTVFYDESIKRREERKNRRRPQLGRP
jgi:GWxTD domain-containing protein